MASYHLTIRKSTDYKASAGQKYDYIARENRYAQGAKAEELAYKGNGNMPAWAQDDPGEFWRAADAYERANAVVYREIEMALPNELNRGQQINLTEKFLKEHLGENYVYSYAIHENNARLAQKIDGEIIKNPHVHIVLCDRKLDGFERGREEFFCRANSKEPEKGGAKKSAEWNDIYQRKEKLLQMRADWAKMQNEALERAGHKVEPLDHRTLEEQRADALARGDLKKAAELERAPEKHLGPQVVAASERAADKLHSVIEAREIRRLAKQIEKMAAKIEEMKKEEVRIERDEKKEVNVSIGEIKAICTARINAIKEELYALHQERKEFEKTIVSEERAELMAKSRYTQGESKAVTKEAREIDEMRTKFKAARDAYKAKPEPKFYQLEAKREHKQEGERLVNWKQDLAQKVAAHKARADALEDRLGTPEAKAKIAEIKTQILAQNAEEHVPKLTAVTDKIEKLTVEKKSLAELRSSANHVRNELKEIKIVLPNGQRSAAVAASVSAAQGRSLLEQAASVARQLDAASRGQGTGLRARINIDDDDNEPGRGKRYKI